MPAVPPGQLPRLWQLLERFRALNPLTASMVEDEVFALAGELGPAQFPRLVRFVEDVLAHYLDSPVKREEREVLREYYYFLDRLAVKLIGPGDATPAAVAVPGAPAPPPPPPVVALVPESLFTSLQWCTLTSIQDVPIDVERAVDAAKRRNFLVDSVLEPLFRLLLLVDRERAFAWQLELCSRRDRPIDPDVARDLLRAWDREPTLPDAVLHRVLAWSEDVKTFRHWPAVTQEADRLLHRHSLLRLVAAAPLRTGLGQRLRRLAPFDQPDKLRLWLAAAVQQMGRSVEFFCDQAERLTGEAGGSGVGGQEWRRAALFQELVWLEQMVPPLLLLSDLMLLAPTGAYDFAMAVFGFTHEAKRGWEDVLTNQCRRAIRRAFVADLKYGRPVTETIRRLCFGDQAFEREMHQELDVLKETFDSVGQREIVVDKLAVIYASYREAGLLATELGRRYRRLMRVLHEDNLRRVLGPEQMRELPRLGHVLVDLATIAADSRRYLSMRRALDKQIAEIVAADLDYTQTIRSLRATYIRRLLQA